MHKCLYSNKAVDDLTEIWNYSRETWSEEQADSYYELLTSFCTTLADRPEIGRKYPDIGFEIRGISIRRHFVLYQSIDSNTIEIIRILHERMDVGSQFG
jgi:toxin ParE1/3/4